VSVLHNACLFVVPDYCCENFESAIYIYLTCGVVCHVHQGGFIMYKMEVVFAVSFWNVISIIDATAKYNDVSFL
jgi:hypothetical protein